MTQKKSLGTPGKIGLGIAGVVVVCAATVALEAFFSGPGNSESWPAAISAVSTIVLVVVTAIYAGLTASSVAVQRDAIGEMRAGEISQQVRRALQLTYPWVTQLRDIERSFPIKQDNDPSDENLAAHEVLLSTIQEMIGVASQLPVALAHKTRFAVGEVQNAVLSCQLIALSMAEAERDNLKISRKILEDAVESGASRPGLLPKLTWSNVLSRFYTSSNRGALKDAKTGAMPEWESLISGFYVIKARKAVEALQGDFESWVQKRDS